MSREGTKPTKDRPTEGDAARSTRRVPTLASRLVPALAVLAYLAVGAAYLEAVPPWEVPDEPMHVKYAEALAEGRLPTEIETWEALHPPGYYAVPAFVMRAARVDEVPRAPGNPRMPFATAATWHVPSDPAVGILRLVRAMSSQLGVLVVALAWATARAGLRGAVVRPALAALLVALLPQFQFISHGVTSDMLAAVVGCAAAYVLVGWAAGRFGDRRAAAALCLVAVLGLLTKANTLPVLAASLPIAIGLALSRRRRGGHRTDTWRALAVPAAAAVGLAVAALAIRLASPDLAERMLAALAWRAGFVRPDQVLPAAVLEMLWHTLVSLYGRLGWQTIDLPTATLGAAIGVLLVSVALFSVRREPAPIRRGLLAAAVICLMSVAAHVKSGMADPQPQGRLLFPAIAAMVLLVAQGIWFVVPRRARWGALAVVVLGLAAVNIHATASLLPDAYAAATGPRPRVDDRVIPLRQTTLWLGTTGRDQMWQPFEAGADGLSRIEVGVKEARGQGDLLMTLEAHGAALAERRVPLEELPDSGWVGFDVGPLDDSAEVEFRLVLEVDAASDDAWVEVFVTEDDVSPGERLQWPGGSGTALVMVTYLGPSAPRIVP